MVGVVFQYGDDVNGQCNLGHHGYFNNIWTENFTVYCMENRVHHPNVTCESEFVHALKVSIIVTNKFMSVLRFVWFTEIFSSRV